MKFTLSVLLTALLSFALGLFLPWWSIAIAAFLIALIIPSYHLGAGFLAGFLGIFAAWFLLALIRDLPNKSLLSHKIAQLLPLGGSTLLLLLVTALVGGLVGGLAAASATAVRSQKKRGFSTNPSPQSA